MTPTGHVLLTGAAGFIGGHLALALASQRWSVTALDPRPCRVQVAQAGAEVLQAEAADQAVLAAVRAGRYAAVVHQGAVSDTLCEDLQLLRDVNVEQPLALAEACRASGTRFIYASSSAVYGSVHERAPVPEDADDDRRRCSGPLNAYGRSKLELDDRMRRAFPPGEGLQWAGLRYTNVFGTHEAAKGRMASILGQWIARAARGEQLDVFGDALLASRDFVPVEHVCDTVLALLRVDHVQSGVYNVGSGTAVMFTTLLHWCLDFSGRPVPLRLVPNPVASRYQYWTCADVTRLQAALPELRSLGADDVRAAAQCLFALERGGDGGQQTRGV